MARRSSPILSIITVALFVAVAGVTGYLFATVDRGDDGAGGTTAGSDEIVVPPPVRAGGDDGTLSPVPVERITVEASSFLAPVGDLTYDPENTLDADVQTAWNSDSEVDGLGEILTYRFAEPIDLQAVRFVNGYAKDDSIWDKNHRIRSLTIRTDGGSREISLLDTADQQQVATDFGTTSEVVLEVTDVYIGSGFETDFSSDLALTEIEFLVEG